MEDIILLCIGDYSTPRKKHYSHGVDFKDLRLPNFQASILVGSNRGGSPLGLKSRGTTVGSRV